MLKISARFIFLYISLVISFQVQAQDSLHIGQDWKILKVKLDKRAEIVIRLYGSLSK